MELVFGQRPELKKPPNKELTAIRGLQHTIEVSTADMDYVVGELHLLGTRFRPGFIGRGMIGDNANTTYSS